MAKHRVVVLGSVGKSILVDDGLGPRLTALEARVAALGTSGGGRHSALSGLQVGNDHPQYTMWQAAEDIQAVWNFTAVPTIGGVALPEYVEDTIGGILVDTATVDFTYDDTANTISAVVPGAALTKVDDTNVTLTLGGTHATALARAASLTLGWTGVLSAPRGGSGAASLTGYLKGNGAAAFTANATIPYSDLTGTPTIPTAANPSGLIGMTAVNGSATTFLRSDGLHAIDPAIVPTWTGIHVWSRTSSTASPGISFQGDFVNNEFSETDASVNNKNWHITVNNAQFLMRVVNDARNSAADFLTVDRSGVTVTGMTFGSASGSVPYSFAGTGATTFGGRVGIGASPTGKLTVISSSASTFPGAYTAWDTAMSVFGPNAASTTGAAVALGYDNTADVAILAALAPNVAWKPFNLYGISCGFFLSGTEQVRFETARASFFKPVRLKGYTVATLPTGTVGDTAYVTDALAPTFLGVIAGGGAITTKVFYNGTNWVAE